MWRPSLAGWASGCRTIAATLAMAGMSTIYNRNRNNERSSVVREHMNSITMGRVLMMHLQSTNLAHSSRLLYLSTG